MKFKVGDRVAVYNSSHRHTGTIVKIQERIVYIERDGDKYQFPAHEKQCYKLKKKKRRVVWIHSSEFDKREGKFLEVHPPGLHGYIKFIEAKS